MTTTIKDALKQWEAQHGAKAVEAEQVQLYGQLPPIAKMDASLSTLKKCVQLSLSSNMIEKITSLSGMDSLKILSLGRNQIKKIENLDGVADTLEQLWMSYNFVEKLAGIEKLKNLRVLYMSNNVIKSWAELERLKELENLQEVLLVGNPIWKTHDEAGDWKMQILARLPNLKKLDGAPVDDEDREKAEAFRTENNL